MKNIIKAAALAALLAAAPSASAEDVPASPTYSRVYINDDYFRLDAYNINGNNYFKLRDMAAALAETEACFDVTWNEAENTIELTTGTGYDGELSPVSRNSRVVSALPTSSALLADGQAVDIEAYNIGGNNYYKLRDLGEVIPFDVYWVEEADAVCIYALPEEYAVLSQSSGGTVRTMNGSIGTNRWQSPVKSYIYQDSDGNFVVVDADDSGESLIVRVDTYDGGTLELTDSTTVPAELPLFGGFCSGEEYNYMVFGQDNVEEDDVKEVIRIVKYDKDFNRLDSASVTGGESITIHPFDFGSLRMSESGGELVIHTARERYTTPDGLNHQSQLTIILDTNSMTVKNDLGEFQANHVSHSFNQFVIHDDGTHVLLDHGDAYPRSVVMNVYNGNGSYTEVDLFNIPGAIGDNTTGVSVGGFAAGENNYIAAITSIDHDNAPDASDVPFVVSNVDRDLILLICEKDNTSTSSVRQVRLTDYIGNSACPSLPYLVNLGDGRFMVLWEEYSWSSSDGGAVYFNEGDGVNYVIIDEEGNVLGEIGFLKDAKLSADCQPIVADGRVIWYTNALAGRMFYSIGID